MEGREPRSRRSEILDAAQEAIALRGVRGLRVEDVAERAGVAVSLIYYHFTSRAGLLRATLERANEQASSGRLAQDGGGPAYDAVERALLGELEDSPAVRRNSLVWGELCASAAFDPELRDAVREATAAWNRLLAKRIEVGRRDGSIRSDVAPAVTAERLGALVDGLASRWHAGAIDLRRARRLLREAVRGELAPDHRAT